MKLCSGKRRGSSKFSAEVQADGGGRRGVGDPRGLCLASGCCRWLHFSAVGRDEPLPVYPWTGVKLVLRCQPLAPGCAGGGYLSGLACRVSSMARAASRSRVGRRPLRPVLKHGPRSLTCARVIESTKLMGAVKAKGPRGLRGDPQGAAPSLRVDLASCGAERAHTLGPERW